jgi:hypothetical protein
VEERLDVGVIGIVIEHLVKKPLEGAVVNDGQDAKWPIVLRVDKMDVARSTRHQVPHVVKDSREDSVVWATLPASWTALVFEVATAPNGLGLRQIFKAGDTLGGIEPIRAGTRHGKALLGQAFLARNLRPLRV